ncbi:hypothetical protein K1T71_003468 [Dendrolimus kikuchii]|uniref:Uncharacterized protein n=1 Tax=Dendrolimus kikuchii TaxID=765133 RepID=A0ACC1DBS6_9NEOP|nr:hypothetical protein K1T71_003468 [Dendrolimus kikuchii]
MTKEETPTSITLNCAYCSKEFKYESEKKRHEESHSPRFKCKVCSKKFSFISSLRRHEKQHDRTGSVKCEQCGGSFRDEILLKRHMNYAHKGCHTCPKCNVSYSSESALRSHIKVHKPEAERKYKCNFDGCNKSFNFAHHWKHHQLTHINKKQYYCVVCHKGFIQLHHLKTHLKCHDPEAYTNCNINGCNKTFSNEYARKRHEVTCSMLHFKKSSDALVHELYTDNKSKLSPEIGDSNILDLTIPCKTISQENKSLLPHENMELAEISDIKEINSCKTVLGECISSNSEDNCLCAQITTEVDEPYNQTHVLIDSRKTFDESNVSDSQLNCDKCECASSCKVKSSNIKNACLKRISLSDTMPDIEYINGTVKLKDTFDYEIPISNDQNKTKDIRQVEDVGAYVLKSCEAALGKCIVSGNGTIGEGCLCAKMMMDEQVTAEEIDDITPQPNANQIDFI